MTSTSLAYESPHKEDFEDTPILETKKHDGIVATLFDHKKKFLLLSLVVLCIFGVFCIKFLSNEKTVYPVQYQMTEQVAQTSGEYLTWDSQVDPFSLENEATFKQRYVIELSSVPNAPIFAYTGGESDIEYYHQHSGVSFRNMGHSFNATILFLEHRYYGKSYPETDGSVNYLSVDAALNDFATIIAHYREKLNSSVVVTAGGSYAGMLSAYMRVKYPHLITAAIASSAPFSIIGVGAENDFSYFSKVTADFKQVHPQCPQVVRDAYSELTALWNDKSKRSQIAKDLNLCSSPTTDDEYVWVQKWMRQAFADLAQGDYPNNDPKLSYPVSQACDILLYKANSLTALQRVALAIDLDYDNPSALTDDLVQDTPCHDYKQEYFPCVDMTGCGEPSNPDSHSWEFQICTTMSYFQSSNGKDDMFFPLEDDLALHNQYCLKNWNIHADKYYKSLTVSYPTLDWSSTSKILFTNGNLDPWCPGGVKKSQGFWTPALWVDKASHHADLNAPTSNDPQSIINARKLEREIIAEFIKPSPDEATLAKLYNVMETEFPTGCY